MKLAAVLLALALFLPDPAHAETVSGRARVVDGDTIEIKDQKIRLWGIDAPELASAAPRTALSIPAASTAPMPSLGGLGGGSTFVQG